MKKQFTKWIFRLLFAGLFLFVLLIIFMLNPGLLYAHKAGFRNATIYHNKPLDKNFQFRLAQSDSLIQSSEIYDSALKMDICLKDGSAYPRLIEKVFGREPLSSFYNKVIFTGDIIRFDSNYILSDGHKLNLAEMLAHARVHCLEFNKYGFWNSNPVAKHPIWKWEGYPEYIARQQSTRNNLQAGIETLLQAERKNTGGWVTLSDGTEILTAFLKYRLLIQYCLEIRKISFIQLMKDKKPEETVRQEMMDWYVKQQNSGK